MGITPILFKFFKMLSDINNITLQYNKKGRLPSRPFACNKFTVISLQLFQQAGEPNPEQFLQLRPSQDLALYNLLVNHQAT
ncbi:hypothetical protein Xkoz_03428 [Xenorhabdus kozodoii]|uniref:Uncharacterized protein n=1 Tax=Xenorhabdus kozodoii TaxID=351676 RepID=A0A2D0L190_9GAMM|nr:hypothetical protein Xkoz_03428 [Xenorhabdus kozodoii]